MAAGLILDKQTFEIACLARGWATDSETARQLGIDKSNLSRILEGKQGPGPKFIAAVLGAFPALGFERLFTVLDDDGETSEEPAA